MPTPLDPHVPTVLVEIARLSVRMTALVAIFVPLERLASAHPQKVFRKAILVDFGYYSINSLVIGLFMSIPAGILAWASNRALPSGFLELVGGLPIWASLILALVTGEIGYYWGHRLSHEIPFLWDFHAIHHSAEEMDFLVNSRAHPLDLVWGRICSLIPIYALGLASPRIGPDSLNPILVSAMGVTWGFFIHANLRWRLGPLEWLVSTPAFHHWHHTKSGPINKNNASTLPWLDRIFGTHHLPDQFPRDYGIKAKVPDSLIGQLYLPISPQAPSLQASVAPAVPPDPYGQQIGDAGRTAPLIS
jgi:sterol desaturase/sphingolipid hydroxylase (fatty acid hydroxylase superfamily)